MLICLSSRMRKVSVRAMVLASTGSVCGVPRRVALWVVSALVVMSVGLGTPSPLQCVGPRRCPHLRRDDRRRHRHRRRRERRADLGDTTHRTRVYFSMLRAGQLLQGRRRPARHRQPASWASSSTRATPRASGRARAFQSRVQSYLATLGASVGIWEIGNEVNGNWTGTCATGAAKLTEAVPGRRGAGRQDGTHAVRQ